MSYFKPRQRKPTSMRPLNVMAFMDGRPGHEKQTQAVLAELASLTPVRVRYVKLPEPSVKRALAGWLDCLAAGLGAGRRGSRAEVPVADFAIGTGAGTHVPLLSLKRVSGTRIVTCMQPGPFFRNRMDLRFVPFHDRPAPADNLFVTVGPPCRTNRGGSHDPRRGLILIGGRDEKSHRWDLSSLRRQISAVVSARPDVQWTMSSSPRTPAETVDWLEAFAGRCANAVFYRCEATPAGWVESMYADCGMVWVTADSVSMTYEALTAGCAVGILPVRWKRKNNKFQYGLDYLVRRGLVVAWSRRWLEKPPPPPVAPRNEAGRCAREILKRWWPDRLR